MKRRKTFLLFALGLSIAWLTAGASWLIGAPASEMSRHLEAREDICERPGLTDLDRATCQSQFRNDRDRLQAFQNELRHDSMKLAFLILLMTWSGGACLWFLIAAARARREADANPKPERSA